MKKIWRFELVTELMVGLGMKTYSDNYDESLPASMNKCTFYKMEAHFPKEFLNFSEKLYYIVAMKNQFAESREGIKMEILWPDFLSTIKEKVGRMGCLRLLERGRLKQCGSVHSKGSSKSIV
jgi:hypothetical protein